LCSSQVSVDGEAVKARLETMMFWPWDGIKTFLGPWDDWPTKNTLDGSFNGDFLVILW
jgi:hypothetical protein